MLRTPAPFRHLGAALALTVLCATAISPWTMLTDRVHLAEALTEATKMRIDPMVEHAQRGRWPRTSQLAGWNDARTEGARIESRQATASGLELTLIRTHDRVRVELPRETMPGGTVRWQCRVHAATEGETVAPLSIPAVCRA